MDDAGHGLRPLSAASVHSSREAYLNPSAQRQAQVGFAAGAWLAPTLITMTMPGGARFA